MNDPFRTLGIDSSATLEEIKTAYRSAAMKYHPDRNPGNQEAERKFKEISLAYETLSDKNRKPSSNNGSRGNVDWFDFNSIFSSFFAEHRRAQQNIGNDSRIFVRLSIEDIAKGSKQVLTIPWNDVCDTCKGNGLKEGKSKRECESCKGKGQTVRTVQVSRSQKHTVTETCVSCVGTGQMASVEDVCPKCDGNGLREFQQQIQINVPAGVNDTVDIRLPGHGLLNRVGGNRGNLYVRVQIKKHPIFDLQGHNVLLEYPLRLSQAIFGDTVSLPTPFDSRDFIIKPGTQSGDSVVLHGIGIPKLSNGKPDGSGDLLVRFFVEIPNGDVDGSKIKSPLMKFESDHTSPLTFAKMQKIEAHNKEKANGCQENQEKDRN